MEGPKSLAFIPDGNRRYARKLGIPYSEAYKLGFEKAKEVLVDWKGEYEKLGVEEVTIWALSTENLSRPRDELEIIFSFVEQYLKEVLESDKLEKLGARVRFVGKLELLPKDIQGLMAEVVERTRDFDGYTVNVAVAYGGRAELLDAFSRLRDSGLEFSEENLKKFLYVPSYPDLIIRTGNTLRSSGFLLWQSAYSEWYFSEKLWPEFDKKEFLRAVDDYLARERRFGR